MTDATPLSRRRVLAALTGLGAVATVRGAGSPTVSTVVDAETLGPNSFEAGTVDLVVDWETGEASGTVDGPTAVLPFADLGPDARQGEVTLTVALPGDNNNPASVWVRADCATPNASTLAAHLAVTLEVRECPDGDVLERHAGTLRDVASALRGGAPLGTVDCVSPDETRCVTVSWVLDDAYAGGESIEWPLTFVAQQCRHVAGATNPFAGVAAAPCPETACDCCVRVGTFELDDGTVEPGVYDFTEGTDAYSLQVTETVDKPSDPSAGGGGAETVGLAFALVDADGEPEAALCRAELKSATQLATYDRPTLGAPDGATPGVLYGPAKVTDPTGPNDYYGLSHLTVSVCQDAIEGECPADHVKEHR